MNNSGSLLAALLISLCAGSFALAAPTLIVDGDGDGVSDEMDDCPYTPPNTAVDAHGCSVAADGDGDGVPDAIDDCPFTPKGAVVDAHGCALDSDLDGVPDGLDLCPHTPYGERVDSHGCEPGTSVPPSSPVLNEPAVPPVSRTAPVKPPVKPPVVRVPQPAGPIPAPEKPLAAAPVESPAEPPRVELPTARLPVEPPIQPEVVELPQAAAPPVIESPSQPLVEKPAVEKPVLPAPAPAVAIPRSSPPVVIVPPSTAIAPKPAAAPQATKPPTAVAPAIVPAPAVVDEPAKPRSTGPLVVETLGTVRFGRNAAELSDLEEQRLERIVEQLLPRLAALPGSGVYITGYLQSGENAGLDARRAQLVRSFLVARDLPPSRVRLSDAPSAPRKDASGQTAVVQLLPLR